MSTPVTRTAASDAGTHLLAGQLRRLLEFAAREVPFYREHWSRAGIDAAALRLPEEFARLPPVGKAELRAAGIESFVSRGCAPSALERERTSGSTGQPQTTLFDRAMRM